MIEAKIIRHGNKFIGQLCFYKTDYLDNIFQIYINYRSWFFIRLGFIRHGSDPLANG